jgi:molybdate transport system ATP-binding protein
MPRVSLSFHCKHRFAGGFTIDAAFDATAGVTALFGPSGSGKTSTLYLIAGLLTPQAGTIAFGQRTWLDTARGVNLSPENRHVGLVFQDHVLFPHLNVEQNLAYGQRRRRGQPSSIEPRKVIEILELGELLRRSPRHLSGGEKQRVALGRALLSGPQLLLMDEPVAALDAALKDRVLSYLQRVIDEWHLPMVYVSHSAAEVQRLAQQVVVLEGGRAVRSGAPREVLAHSSAGGPV